MLRAPRSSSYSPAPLLLGPPFTAALRNDELNPLNNERHLTRCRHCLINACTAYPSTTRAAGARLFPTTTPHHRPPINNLNLGLTHSPCPLGCTESRIRRRRLALQALQPRSPVALACALSARPMRFPRWGNLWHTARCAVTLGQKPFGSRHPQQAARQRALPSLGAVPAGDALRRGVARDPHQPVTSNGLTRWVRAFCTYAARCS